MDFNSLSKQISNKQFSPLYYLHGEEPYFIDKLTRQLEKGVLEPHEEAFNKVVVYGTETSAGKLLNELKSFPMMSKYRLVVLREAQRLKKDEYQKLVHYLENPVSTSIFVISFKGKGMDGRSKAAKILNKTGVSFRSNKIYDNKVGQWIENLIRDKGYTVDPDALQVLVGYLGTNLGLIENEVDKIILSIKGKGSTTINKPLVYEMINIDKDFNVFELIDNVGRRNHVKSHLIINQMMKNVKDNNPILIVNQLFQFFNKLTLLKNTKTHNVNGIASMLGLPPFIAQQYVAALKQYNQRQLFKNLAYILETDLFLKGIRSTHMGQDHILKTLVYRLLN